MTPTRTALKWSFASELATKAIQPVVFVVLARLLTPEDYGVMTAALMVIAFSQIFWEAGMSKALIQRQTDIEAAANAAFWINAALGIVIVVLLFLLARPIALTFFQDEKVVTVLRVMTLQVVLGALSSVPTALLQKELAFQSLFRVRLAAVGLPALASIPLAWHGWGYWALVAGALVGQLAQTLILWRMSPWRPRLRADLAITRQMGRFGAWVGLTGLLHWFYAWADSLVVGHYLGTHDLGLFRTGSQFAVIAFGMLFGPVAPVLYSQLSRIGSDKDRMRQVAEFVLGISTILAIPTAMMIFLFSNYLEELVFGSKWAGVGTVLGVMALTHGFAWVVGMNGEFYRAMGKPSYETIVTGGTLLVYLVVYLFAVQWGLDTFVWARMLLAIGAVALHVVLIRQVLNVRAGRLAKQLLLVAFVSALVGMSSRAGVTLLLDSTIARFLTAGLISLLVISTVIYVAERTRTVADLIRFVKAK